jgi:hemerythrin-like domain-containing protein
MSLETNRPLADILEVLEESHASIERHLALLGRGDGALPGAQADRRRIVECLDRAMTIHLRAEEQDLFPDVLAAAHDAAQRATAFEQVAHLLVEHREIAALWEELRAQLVPPSAEPPAAQRKETAAEFVAAFTSHLERERQRLRGLLSAVRPERLAMMAQSFRSHQPGPGSPS